MASKIETRARGRKSCVLVIGGGIAGATAADRLGRAGVEVHVVEKEADIGGRVRELGCKATDVCLRCNACVADDILRSVRDVPAVRFHLRTRLEELRPAGDGKRYAAVLVSGNGAGARKTKPKARVPDTTTIEADAVVIATGFEPYHPCENNCYGYGRVPNVITGLEAERMLAAGRGLVRPTDGKAPKRTAFVLCAGSRTEEVFRDPDCTGYCSAVCCAYSLRMARRIRHEAGDSEITVFHMDIQNFGKGFDMFYGACGDMMNFVRSRPYELRPGPGGSIRVKHAPGGNGAGVREDEFDLVILATGMRPSADGSRLADRLGLPADENGFIGLKRADALADLQRDSIYAVGACEGPKDIAGCIAQAEAVSAEILARLGIAGGRKAGAGKRGAARSAVAVIGAGVAGLQAAVSLGNLGYRVLLFHRGRKPGGIAASFPELFGHLRGDSSESLRAVRSAAARLVEQATGSRNIRVHAGAALESVKGEAGDFLVTVSPAREGDRPAFRAGAVVFATGSCRMPALANSGTDGAGRTVGIAGAVERIRAGAVPRRVAIMLDMAGEQDRSVTAEALSLAEIMAARFGARVKVYCRHMRVVAAGLESLYRRAREAGVLVVKFENKPLLSAEGALVAVTAADPVAGALVSDEFDLVVMADLRRCGSPGQVLGAVQGLRGGPDHALQYDNVWLAPALTNRPGIFVAGGARGNSDFRDALTDGMAVAMEVHALLTGDGCRPRKDAAEVDSDKCVLCLTCLRVCPHGAISVDTEKKAARVSAVSCRRCGLCAVECPAGAIQLPGYTDDQIAAEVGAKPEVTVFACENSAVRAGESAADASGTGARVIRVPCAGKVDPRSVLKALEKGARKVLVLGCHPESCRYLTGATRALQQRNRLAAMLAKAGFDGSRVEFGGIASVEANRYAEYMKSATR